MHYAIEMCVYAGGDGPSIRITIGKEWYYISAAGQLLAYLRIITQELLFFSPGNRSLWCETLWRCMHYDKPHDRRRTGICLNGHEAVALAMSKHSGGILGLRCEPSQKSRPY